MSPGLDFHCPLGANIKKKNKNRKYGLTSPLDRLQYVAGTQFIKTDWMEGFDGIWNQNVVTYDIS